ncbi:CHAD domain-containing protein [Curtobacterium sp. MCLR17_007]|uniref:CYTH and CHAD domain-containing protein n=1 Tax=Curtobacterium sp. MCLR17_007 TaxID=2175648 RepID=UPI000DA98111|nr:CHAD domain-containing protein [Curtobacterium sp. MCLR17_007]WIB59711.1 CHAD domain-containing protein [Curtobacterium sp. MCLR17_007]
METTTRDTLADPRRTWRIPDDRRLPALEPYADDVRRLPSVTVRETLWDTDDRALAFAGIELLHADPLDAPRQVDDAGDGGGDGGDGSSSGGDGGWSVDRGQGPEAVGVPGAPLPRDPVEAVLRGRPVRPVRVRDTTTTLVRLHGRDGRLRAEVADVRVDEGDRDTALLRSARWWALTDDGGPGQVVRAVERAVTDAADDDGRAPGDPVPTLAPVRRPVTGGSERPRPGSAAAFVRGVLAPLRTELLAVDPRVRADSDDVVHAFRKALRRLRSVLAAYRGALDSDLTESLRARLRSTARVAGVARDAEVLRDRVEHTVAMAPSGSVDTAVLDHLRAAAEADRRAAVAALRDELRSGAWFGALDQLDDLVDRAPAGTRAKQDAVAFTTQRIHHERARVRRALDGTDGLPADGLEPLHDVRKAARRLRYALEAAGDVPDVGKRRLGRFRRVQETLGDVLDAEHAAVSYRRLAAAAAESGTDTFGYGVLAMVERRAAEHHLDDARRALGQLHRAVRG